MTNEQSREMTPLGNTLIADEPGKKTRDKVYHTIKQCIMENRLKSSVSYLETELADRLGVSRTPVREAALQLERDGFVKVRPRHGITVLPIAVQDMREIYQIQAELEPLAVALAARRGLSHAEFTPLVDCITKMETALEQDDLNTWAHADDIFHNLVVSYSQNRRLARMISQFRDQVHRARMATLHLRPKPLQSNVDHELLVRHLRNRDEAAARDVHHRHLTRAGTMLIELLEKNGLDNL